MPQQHNLSNLLVPPNQLKHQQNHTTPTKNPTQNNTKCPITPVVRNRGGVANGAAGGPMVCAVNVWDRRWRDIQKLRASYAVVPGMLPVQGSDVRGLSFLDT